MTRVFKITPKRVRKTNETVSSTEMSLPMTATKYALELFYDGSKEINDAYWRICQFDRQKIHCSKNNFEVKQLI